MTEIDDKLSNLGIDVTNLGIDISNLDDDVKNLDGDVSNLGIDISNLGIDEANLDGDVTNLGIDEANLDGDMRIPMMMTSSQPVCQGRRTRSANGLAGIGFRSVGIPTDREISMVTCQISVVT